MPTITETDTRNGQRTLTIPLPPMPKMHLPRPTTDEMIFAGAVTMVAAAGLIELPVALALGVGYLLLSNRLNHHRS